RSREVSWSSVTVSRKARRTFRRASSLSAWSHSCFCFSPRGRASPGRKPAGRKSGRKLTMSTLFDLCDEADDLAAALAEFEVVAVTQWAVHWGGLNNPHGGLGGQLTKCRWKRTNIVFYVRENIAAEQFCVSSGERKGWKEGRL